MANTFHCSVVTPERAVLETDATLVVFPAWDGEVGIMRGRAPLLTRMGIGLLRVKAEGGETLALYVDGGFAQMVDDKLTILTEQAKDPADLDPEEAQRLLAEAREMKATDPRAFQLRQAALERARVQRRLTSQ
ncbi:MAG: ATP synthase F1 subunit epsilon [Acidobacteria bacterium]|nr:MAG: ATP synthase F1 subunit epsilon [Acidobacteriota bacterium]